MKSSQKGVVLEEQRENSLKEDFEWAFGLNRLSLDAIGIWPHENDRAGHATLRHLLTPVIILCIIVGLTLPLMYALSRVFQEIPLVIDNLIPNSAALNSIIKIFLLWCNRQVLKPVIMSAMDDWNRSKADWEFRIMVKQARRARMFTISCIFIMIFCFFGFTFSPFLNLSVRNINNITDLLDGRYFPFQTYYPFDAGKSPFFELIYASQLFCTFLCCVYISIPDTFFGALVFHACAQNEILRLRLSKIAPIDSEFLKCTMYHQQYFTSRLRKVIDIHVRLIRYTDAIERSFNLLILVHVVFISLTICFLGFGVITTIKKENERPSIIQIVTLGGTVFNLMVHLLIYCIASETLVHHSLGLINSVYSSDWYSLPAKYFQNLVLIMLRSKWPLQLSAGKLFYLSLNSYLKILKTSFGYISILLAVSS